MGKYKMICLDIDGTLLNSEHKISQKTKSVLIRVVEKMALPVVLVSARPPKGIFFLLEELDIHQPIICYSGALIMEETNILRDITIPAEAVRSIVEIAADEGIHVSLYKRDEWYAEAMDQWAIQEGRITNTSPEIIDFNSLLKEWHMTETGPNKVLCMGSPESIQALKSRLSGEKFKNLNIYPSKPTYLEIMPCGASKPSAIEFLRMRFNLAQSEIIAIGDNYNDMSMIEYAGLGIAMGNAPEEVKSCADAVTLSNDEDGVASAIEKFVG